MTPIKMAVNVSFFIYICSIFFYPLSTSEAMQYSNLEEAYGSPFGSRAPVTHGKKEEDKEALAGPARTNQAEKHKELLDKVSKSLPLDKSAETENFVVKRPSHPVARQVAREHFTSIPPAPVSGGGNMEDDKLSRILRLIEQNRTGYERSSQQDMFLYVVTGVIFLFTFDTFVMLGKTMRR
jgi:hypothetical protein